MKTLQLYVKYNCWANDQLFSIIERESDDAMLDKTIESSFSSLRKTIYHIWDAEYIWLQRLNGKSPSKWPGENFKGTFSEAKEKILLISNSLMEFVLTSDDEKLLSLFTYKNIEGKTFTNPVWQSIQHVMNHSTYHRGQVVTMLRQLGIKTIPSTDFITFCRIVPV